MTIQGVIQVMLAFVNFKSGACEHGFFTLGGHATAGNKMIDHSLRIDRPGELVCMEEFGQLYLLHLAEKGLDMGTSSPDPKCHYLIK
jgi:hypothetical protein